MPQFLALLKKELRLSFNSPIAYIFLVAFLALSMWLFFRGFFLIGQADLRGYFDMLPWLFLFLIPSLTMRAWSEEYRQGTIETLLTSSISLRTAILGKLAAIVAILSLALTLTFTLPLSVSLIGDLDAGQVAVSYLGALTLGTAFAAIGLFISALTNNQIVAFIVTVLVAFVGFILGEQIVTLFLPSFLVPVFEMLGLGAHYAALTRGVVDTRDVVYFASLIGIFVYGNFLVLRSTRA